MDNLPFDLTGLDSSEVDALKGVYKALKEKFDISIPDDFNVDVNQFDFIRCYKDQDHCTDIALGGVLRINNVAGDSYLIFMKVRYYYANSSSHLYRMERLDTYRYIAWGLADMKKDFGRVLIRRETFTDRVLSIVHPVELEFEDDKPFSHKFYVVANDETKALNSMTWNFRNTIMTIDNPDTLIEIVGNNLIVGDNYWLETNEVVDSAEMARKIASIR